MVWNDFEQLMDPSYDSGGMKYMNDLTVTDSAMPAGISSPGHYKFTKPVQSCRCRSPPSDAEITPVIRGRRHSDGRDAYKKSRKRKTVRFADDMGLTLTEVRHYVVSSDEGFRWACSATSVFDDENIWEDEIKNTRSPLTLAFTQPGVEADFPLRVQQQNVCLENCLIDNEERKITAVARVANKSYTKRVVARASTNTWVTYEDIEARFVPNSSDGTTDRFIFSITVPWFMARGGRVDFALRYVCDDQTHWDNNRGKNYTVFC